MPSIQGALNALKMLFRAKQPELTLDRLAGLRKAEYPVGDFDARAALHLPPSQVKDSELSRNEFNRRIVANEMQSAVDDYPTTTFYGPDNSLQGAYQLNLKPNETEIAYLLSRVPGLGTELLEQAYRAAKLQVPNKPVALSAIPGSEEFYRKQLARGWKESSPEGVPKFIRKAHGGLAQVRSK